MAEPKKGTAVMVVEDESLLLEAITRKIKLAGYEAISCTSGQQALDYLKELTELPAVIWLDYHLGDINGLEFMGKLKENKAWTKIPVVVVSNSASDEKVHNMMALGARQYLLKAEHRLEEIIKVVEKILKEGQSDE